MDIFENYEKETNKLHTGYYRKNKKQRGKEWWNNLSPKEKSAYIAKKERSKKKGIDYSVKGKREKLPNGAVKIWTHSREFRVYRDFMLDKDGNPLPEWL